VHEKNEKGDMMSKEKRGEYTLWSPSAIGAIYTDNKGEMYVYDEKRSTLENLRTHKIFRVKAKAEKVV
jgi:hypothetical protein